MAARKRVRYARNALLLAAVVVILASGYIRIRQYVFRRRIELMLTDLRNLELRKASAEDVRQFARKWSFEPQETPAEQCPNGLCRSYNFVQTSPTVPLLKLIGEGNFNKEWESWTLGLLGGRPASILGHVRVRQDKLWSKDVSVWVSLPPENGEERILLGSAGTPWRFQSKSDRDRPATVLADRLRHADYLVGKYVGLGNADAGPMFHVPTIWAEFSPYADNRVVVRLMQFDLSCLTRLRPCQESDLMPTAWTQYTEDKKNPQVDFACTPDLSKRVASIADEIIVAGIDSLELTHPEHEGGPYRLQSAHMVKPLEGAKYVLRHFHGDIEVANGNVPTTADTNTTIQAGRQYILLLQNHAYGGYVRPALYPCGVLTANSANLAMAREVASDSDQEF